MLDWIYEYNQQLARFGVSDDLVGNGFITLQNAYRRKIHMQIYPLVSNILIKEKEAVVEKDKKGLLFTFSAQSIFEIFNSPLDLLV